MNTTTIERITELEEQASIAEDACLKAAKYDRQDLYEMCNEFRSAVRAELNTELNASKN